MTEEINHPERYGGDTTYECIKVLEAWLPTEQYKGFLRGNALKYLCRVGKKDNTVQELKKAEWYLNKLFVCFSHPSNNISNDETQLVQAIIMLFLSVNGIFFCCLETFATIRMCACIRKEWNIIVHEGVLFYG